MKYYTLRMVRIFLIAFVSLKEVSKALIYCLANDIEFISFHNDEIRIIEY